MEGTEYYSGFSVGGVLVFVTGFLPALFLRDRKTIEVAAD
jgi:hypothetical protein